MTSTGPGEVCASPRGHKQNLACTKTQRKGVVTPQETEPKLLVRVGGSPVKVWAHHGDEGTGNSSPGGPSWRVPLTLP